MSSRRLTTANSCAHMLVLTVACAAAGTALLAQHNIRDPPTKQVDHLDTYHGVDVLDRYRWLEDARAPETTAWVEAQNRLTQAYLAALPFRDKVAARVRALSAYTRCSRTRGGASAFRKGPHLFFKRQDPGQALLRVDTRSGHAASNLDKQLDKSSDTFVFLMRELGVVP